MKAAIILVSKFAHWLDIFDVSLLDEHYDVCFILTTEEGRDWLESNLNMTLLTTLVIKPCGKDKLCQLDSESTIQTIDEYILTKYKEIAVVGLDESNVALAGLIRDHYQLDGDGYAITKRFRDKYLMREALGNSVYNLPYTSFQVEDAFNSPQEYYRELVCELGNKFIVKPRSMAGAIGVRLITNESEFINYCEQELTRQDKLMAEKYIEGMVYLVNSTVFQGISKDHIITQSLQPQFNNTKQPIIVHPIVQSSSLIVEKLIEAADKIIDLVQYKNGSCHVEFMVTEENEIYFIEIGARVGGGMYKNLFLNAMNKNFVNDHVLSQLNVNPHTGNLNPGYGAHCFIMPNGLTVLKELLPNLKSQYKCEFLPESSRHEAEDTSLLNTSAILILWSTDQSNYEVDLQELLNIYGEK